MLEFGIINNVEISVMNKYTHVIKKTVRTHNKATRNMVEGIMRFLMGHFNATSLNDKPQYSDDIEKKYIPRYIGFGNGGVVDVENTRSYYYGSNAPVLSPSWNSYVPYNSSKLQREIFDGKKFEVNLITDTFADTKEDKYSTPEIVKRSEMDSMMFFVEILPDDIPRAASSDPVKSFFMTEVGLYSSDDNSGKLLAHVKLNNHIDHSSGDFLENITQEDLKCYSGIVTFNVPNNSEIPFNDYLERTMIIVNGIKSGTFEVTIDDSVYRDKEETPGKLYLVTKDGYSEDISGIVDYESGILRIYDLPESKTKATVKYTVNQNMTMNTDALYVGENDSIVVRWVITFAAIGKDNVFRLVTTENGESVEHDVIEIPNLADVPVIPLENLPQENTEPLITIDRSSTRYDDNDPVEIENHNITGTLLYGMPAAHHPSYWFSIYNLDDWSSVYQPNGSLIVTGYALYIDITFPYLGIGSNSFPALQDGTELLCVCKVDGTVKHRKSDASIETVNLNAGYFSNTSVWKGLIDTVLVIPENATTLTLTTYKTDTLEIIRNDVYNLNFTYEPHS